MQKQRCDMSSNVFSHFSVVTISQIFVGGWGSSSAMAEKPQFFGKVVVTRVMGKGYKGMEEPENI